MGAATRCWIALFSAVCRPRLLASTSLAHRTSSACILVRRRSKSLPSDEWHAHVQRVKISSFRHVWAQRSLCGGCCSGMCLERRLGPSICSSFGHLGIFWQILGALSCVYTG